MLSEYDQKRLSFRLGIDLSAGAFLCVGLLYGYVFPEQAQVAALIQAFAALMVSRI